MSKKTLVYILLGAVLYIGVVLLYQRFQGSVILTTNSKTALFYSYESGKKSIIGKSSVTIRGPGHNTVYAEDGDGISVVSFIVERWNTKNISVPISQPVSPELFTSELAQDIIVSGGSIRFLHPETHQVLQAAEGERASVVDGFFGARSVYWIDYQTAVYEDIFGAYNVFQKNKSIQLQLPNSKKIKPTVTSVSVSNDGEVALIVNGDLYYYPSVSGSPKLLEKNVQSDAALDVGKSVVVYAEKVDAGDDTFSGAGSLATNEPSLRIYNGSTGLKETEGSVPENSLGTSTLVTGVSLSPQVDKILFTTVSGVYLYQIAETNFTSIELEPSELPLSALWASQSEVVYTTNFGVWLTNIEKQMASLITKADGIELSSSLEIYDNNIWFGDNSVGRLGTGSIKHVALPN